MPLIVTFWAEPERYGTDYWQRIPGRNVYFTADAAAIDGDGYVWFSGRADEIIKIAAHRLGTIEVETEIGSQTIRAEVVVIATGSEAAELRSLPFGGRVISSTEALALTEVPSELVVVGAGYIGLELGTAFAKLGAKVTVVEALPLILPQYDAELTRPVAKRLHELGIEELLSITGPGHAEEATWVPLTPEAMDACAVRANVLQAHQELAQVPGTCGEQFRAVAACLDATPQP